MPRNIISNIKSIRRIKLNWSTKKKKDEKEYVPQNLYLFHGSIYQQPFAHHFHGLLFIINAALPSYFSLWVWSLVLVEIREPLRPKHTVIHTVQLLSI